MDRVRSKNKMPPKHGGDIQGFAEASGCSLEDVMDFSSNINPLGLSEKLQRVYQASVSDLTHYPDPAAQKMCQLIAQKHQLEAGHVLAGNGSIALIDLAIRSLRPKKALLVEPCFNEYRRLLSLSGADIDHVLLAPENEFQFPFDEICKKLSAVDLLIVGHPNNPTGSALSPEKLTYLINEAGKKGKHLLIDEAFIDWFEDDSVIGCIHKYPSVVVLRSLTKFYALAGIRAGYACAHKDIIDTMRTFQETWSCNSVAQNLALAAFSDEAFQIKSRTWFEEESSFMWESLRRIPAIKVFPSKANFFLCHIKDPSMADLFWQEMMRLRIYLRDVTDLIGLDKRYFRLGLKTREENHFLLKAIKESLQDTRHAHDSHILSVHS